MAAVPLQNDTMAMRSRMGRWIAYFFRSVLWSLNLLLVFYTLLGYWLLYALPTEHWMAGMIMISLPVVWVLNLVLVVLWLPARPWRSGLSGITLLIGMVLFGSRTFVFNVSPPNANPTQPPGAFTVLSYNLQSFGLDANPERRVSSPVVRRTMNYVLRHDAPIKCFQELFVSTKVADYDLMRRFPQAGYRYSALLHPERTRGDDGMLGLAVFSRYPIIRSGREPFGSGVNGVLWADIQLGADTIRVINVHLQSMGIRVGRVLRQDELDGVKHETRGVLSALRNGFIERREQVRRVEQYIRNSPYPVIVTGDHNDTPYSVVYERLRRLLPNSFEEAGRGFGFTYNRPPGFIRIDNQFHDPRLTAVNFETVNSIRYSDHYPIVGTYRLKGK